MAVFQKIRRFFVGSKPKTSDLIPQPGATYVIRPLTQKQLKEVWHLNQSCFDNGEEYPRSTLNYLLEDPSTLSYRIVTADDAMVGFVFVAIKDGIAHLTTIGVATEHRQRGLAQKMLEFIEKSLIRRQVNMICLEVRVSNLSAQNLYRKLNYTVMQRLSAYYNNGEDGFLMVKSLV